MRKLVVIFSLLASSVSFTQEELTVFAAIQRALENNFQIKLVHSNHEVSQKQNTWGQAGLIPTFSLNIGNNTSLQDNTNNPATFFPGVLFNDNLQASLNMSWTVFSGFGIKINKERFEKLEEQTAGNAIVVIETTIYEVILAYYTAVVQHRKLDLLKAMLMYSSEKLAYHRMKSEMGLSTSLDLLEFENHLLTDSTNFILQDYSYRNSLRNLNLLMADDVELSYDLVDSLEFETPAAPYEELKKEMLATNQNLKNQFLNQELKELDIESRRSAYYPIITLNLGTTPSVGYFEIFGTNGFSSNTSALAHTATINIKYDIFQGMNRKRNVEISRIQHEMAGMQIEELELKLSHQLRANFDLYKTRSQIKTMSLERVKNANKLWNLGKEKYDLGLINVFNLNDIKLAYEQAVLNYYDRLFEMLQTHYDLLRLTGRISQEYKIADTFDE